MDGASLGLTATQAAHVRIMRVVVSALQDTPMVLKGGTALLLCYGLDRFSEDLDFDAPKKLNLESRLEDDLFANDAEKVGALIIGIQASLQSTT
jgi:predicted nucleotidyltransferase component of viral defense system